MELLLISSSVVHGYGFLDHPEPLIREFLGPNRRVAFIPFAARDHAAYTDKVRERLARMELDVVSHDELETAEAIFIGGGNTFRLLKTLYERNLLDVIRARVRGGTLYVGSSAGSILACPTIRTTNDMPIVEPAGFEALGLVPFQINAHYLDADPASTHMGETREERLRQFHEENPEPVVGLREGTMLRVEGDSVVLQGGRPARIFRPGKEPVEVPPGTALDELLAP
jgi:dipeptidase E